MQRCPCGRELPSFVTVGCGLSSFETCDVPAASCSIHAAQGHKAATVAFWCKVYMVASNRTTSSDGLASRVFNLGNGALQDVVEGKRLLRLAFEQDEPDAGHESYA